ncbi:MAG: amidase [Sphingomonadales bacterium]|jgi:amidase|nr:amidase [Sphingomonadales bacterium]
MEALHELGLAEASRRMREGALSPVALAEAMLERIAALEPKLHAFARVTDERALEDAHRAEAELARGQWRGPLHGVPIALKDLVDTAGIATEAGMKALRGRVPDEDSTVAARLREAGAVLLGKLAMTEGAFAEHHPEVQPPLNPWRGEHWTGVSSSGSGVAVAAGLCLGALGSDTGGSIRFPSAACGITGLKPTWGRVSRHGIFPLAPSLDHVGPMARSAEDAALLLGAIAGADPSDPTALRAPTEDYAGALDRGIRGVTVGIDRDWCLAGVDGEVADSFDAALDSLASAGAELRAVRMPDTTALAAGWVAACAVEAALAHEAIFRERGGDYGPALAALVHIGGTLPAVEYARIGAARLEIGARLAALFDEVALLATPALPLPVPTLAEAAAGTAEPAQMLRFTALWNFAGNPTLSLPCGFDRAGLPIGFQIVGPALGEAALLAAGAAFQRITDWHRRRPPVARL